ncbi:MAG: hypothetical protein ACYDHX_03305 [Methanothrix sp.]
MLIVKGVNFFPKQIEQTFLSIPGIGNNYHKGAFSWLRGSFFNILKGHTYSGDFAWRCLNKK